MSNTFENQNGHSAAYLTELAREFHEAPDAETSCYSSDEEAVSEIERLPMFLIPQAG